MNGGVRSYGGGLETRVTELERRRRTEAGAGTLSKIGTFTLSTGTASTVISDASVNSSSLILWAPTNDGAISFEGAIRIAPGSGAFTVFHASASFARTYAYAVFNPA